MPIVDARSTDNRVSTTNTSTKGRTITPIAALNLVMLCVMDMPITLKQSTYMVKGMEITLVSVDPMVFAGPIMPKQRESKGPMIYEGVDAQTKVLNVS